MLSAFGTPACGDGAAELRPRLGGFRFWLNGHDHHWTSTRGHEANVNVVLGVLAILAVLGLVWMWAPWGEHAIDSHWNKHHHLVNHRLAGNSNDVGCASFANNEPLILSRTHDVGGPNGPPIDPLSSLLLRRTTSIITFAKNRA